ncbi:acyltransferase [Paraburkholderia sediminicola]|uniref:acyltransferase family protein n=1 Tax=Paraburkholderia sediminicola TaxID=458836 RepID=UPI0038BA10F3
MTENRMGAFDNLRLALAVVVTIAHLNELQGIGSRIYPSLAAVSAFFCLAGFFCFRSYRSCVLNGGGLKAYAIKRFFRIYPAYATVVVVPAAVWASMHGPSFEEARYLIANLATLNFLHPCIGGLFSDHRYCAVNGALWTIKNELVLYGSVPIFFWLLTSTTTRAKIWAASAIFVGASTYFYVINYVGHTALAKQFLSGLAYFLAGSIMAWRSESPRLLRLIETSTPASLVAIIAIAIVAATHPNLMMLPAVGPLCVAWAAVRLGQFPMRLRPRHDLSYTLYLCHFPVIQLFLSWYHKLNAYESGAAVFISFVLAYCLTRAIEVPGMKIGQHLSRLTLPVHPVISPAATS